MAPKKSNEKYLFVLNFQIIIIAFTYFWAGIHKINSNFAAYTYMDMLNFFFSPEQASKLKSTWVLIPAIEIVTGIGVLFNKTRRLAVALGILTHIIILIYIGPWGSNYNSAVWPWNIQMIVFLAIIYVVNYEKVFLYNQKSKGVSLILLTFIFILPIFSLFGKWDTYLSMNLYSSKTTEMFICIDDKALYKLPDEYKPYFYKTDKITGGKLIDVSEWALKELNVTLYPERRILKDIAKSFCKYGFSEKEMVFLIYDFPLRNDYEKYTCVDLFK